MQIKVDYYIKQDGHIRVMNTSITEVEIIDMLERKFREGDLPCPIHFDREKCKVEFTIDQIII